MFIKPASYTNPASLYAAPGKRETARLPRAGEQQFDTLIISRTAQKEQDFVARVSNDLRVRHSSGDLARIKEDIAAGRYEPDAMAVAAKLMLEG